MADVPAVFILLSFLTVVSPQGQTNLTECMVERTLQNLNTYFYRDGRPLPTKALQTVIKEESANDCAINTTSLVEHMNLPLSPLEMAVTLFCKRQLDLHFLPFIGVKYKHILFHIEILNCTVDMVELDNLLDVADTRVFNTMLTIFRKSEAARNVTGQGIKSVVAFYHDSRNQNNQSVTDIFDENDSYPELVEIGFSGMSLISLPDSFENMFPNLQSLEIGQNKLSVPPPTFPWIKRKIFLPRNLSRSLLMQNHYTGFDHVEIPSNIFRRYFTLYGNNIEDLSNFSFHGLLDKIDLKNNGLMFLGNDTFRKTTGLQNLDLSSNLISELPPEVFCGLTSLTTLDISNNKIERLNKGVFDDLSSLKILNLGTNSITHIESGTFSLLQQLEVIRLDHNMLHQVIPEVFPLDTVNLKEVYFHNNPLETLPYFPFWIRGLQLADFHSTNISLGNFTRFLEDIDLYRMLHSVIDSASDSDTSDILKKATTLTKIDLTNSSVTGLSLGNNLSLQINRTLLVILLHFEIILKDNPILCDCNINNVSEFIQYYVANKTLSTTEYFFEDWTCRVPSELAGRKMLKVLPAETYCPFVVEGCPAECECFKRSTIDHIIVDCRDRELREMHKELPFNFTLELWYSGNNITKLNNIPFAESVIYLDVSFNKIETISGELILKMKKLTEIHLQRNVLAYLPQELTTLQHLQNATVWPNPLTCDCNTLWLKRFLDQNRHIINKADEMSCKIEHEDGMLIREVADEKFVCHKNEFDELRYVVMPSIVCSTVVFILLIGAFVFYAYRLECKVLLFVYFGLHPFDKDLEDKNENLDCVIVHSGQETDWVMDQIVAILEDENYHFVVCDMARDFVIGFSFQENLTRTVRHSKRMMFCLSQDWNTSSESFNIAWRIAQEKIKETKSHYGIIVSHELNLQEIKDQELKRFIKRGRFVSSKDKLFKNKVLYYMPQIAVSKNNSKQEMVDRNVHFRKKSEYVSRCFINSYCDDNVSRADGDENLADDVFDQGVARTPNCHAFIAYHEEDLQYVLQDLVPLLEEKGFTYCIADRDFVLGASIEENILNAIATCHRTIFILSPANVQDEWSLFTFRTAYEKALREKSNYLLVIIKEDLVSMSIDGEIKHYLKNYICLNANDRWFEKKLLNGLPLIKDREDLHSSPLFINSNEINITVDQDSDQIF